MIRSGSLLSDIPAHLDAERFDALLARPGVRIERIVSAGQASASSMRVSQVGQKIGSICVFS